jgi:hypothetical protein
VRFAAITLCVAFHRVFIAVYFIIDSVRKLLDLVLFFVGRDLAIDWLIPRPRSHTEMAKEFIVFESDQFTGRNP